MHMVITTVLSLLTVLVPLALTTINYELFEFPKFILLLAGALVITVFWVLHIYKTKDYAIIPRTPISYAVLAILATQALATIFSMHPYTSFWGYYSRFHQGLLTTICYTIIYFAAVKWLDTKSTHKLIKISIGTAFVVSLYAILERLGIDKNFWIQDVQNRVFSTLGQPNWLAAYLIPNLFLVLLLSQSAKKSGLPTLYLLFSTLFLALIFTKSRSGFLGFGLAYLTYWGLLVRQSSFAHIKLSFFRISSFVFLISLVFAIPKLKPVSPPPTGTVLDRGGTESGDIRKIVWSGALKLVAKRPLLGYGPETFAYTYYNVRPEEHNQTSEWDFLYNKAHNEYLNYAATVGIIGLLAYLAWHFALFMAGLEYPFLAAAVVSFAVTNFFGFSVIPVYLLMTILGAFPSTLTKKYLPSKALKGSAPLLLLLVLIYPLRLFLSDYYFARGKANFDQGQLGSAATYIEKATRLRPSLDLYHNYLGETYAGIAGASDSSDFAERAVAEAKLSSLLNPNHLNAVKSRAKIYLTLASLDPLYYQSAKAELVHSRELAPTDPKLAYNLGLVYTRTSELDLSEQMFLTALALKPDYHEAYYALTLLYEQTKKTDKLPSLLQDARNNLATYSAQLKEKIDKYLP